jgi:hypothetical protein
MKVLLGVLIRFAIAAAVIGLSACAPAPAQPTAGPILAPTVASTLAPTTAPLATAAVPLATSGGPAAWTPASRTKTTGCVSQGGLPDPACTPGAIDPRVTTTTTATTICTSGYTATVRPPVAVTDRIKREQMTAYSLEAQPLNDYELDQVLSRAVAV